MAKALFENTSNKPLFVGGKMISIGAMKYVKSHQVPDKLKKYMRKVDGVKTEKASPNVSLLDALIAKPIADITAQFHTLSDDDLRELGMMENNTAKPRAGLLSDISGELLAREKPQNE